MQVKLNLIVAATAILMGGTVYAQDMVVKIGHVAPLSGTAAHLGKDNENGARMAIDELNAKGVMIGGKKVKFELLAEDDASDPKQGTQAAQKLRTRGCAAPACRVFLRGGAGQSRRVSCRSHQR